MQDEMRKTVVRQYKKLVYNIVRDMETGCADVGRRYNWLSVRCYFQYIIHRGVACKCNIASFCSRQFHFACSIRVLWAYNEQHSNYTIRLLLLLLLLLFVTFVSTAKTAEPTEMAFGKPTRMGQRNHTCIRLGRYPTREGTNFWGLSGPFKSIGNVSAAVFAAADHSTINNGIPQKGSFNTPGIVSRRAGERLNFIRPTD